jgi:SAM-dependent methyltransferase
MRPRRLIRRLKGKGVGGGAGKRRARFQEFSTSGIHEAVFRAIRNALPQGFTGAHLDIGSGKGELLTLLATRFPGLQSSACDCTEQLMKRENQKVELVDLNRQPLPFADERFDLVTSSETIEHLENYWSLLREVHRVLRPDGIAVFTTPNILNLRSRLRFFATGFYNLFGPLTPEEPDVYSPRGHINPVGWFYLANALMSVGFDEITMSVDKYQRRSLVPFALLLGPIRLSSYLAMRREAKKYFTVNEQNASALAAINSTDLLLGRTLVVRARKRT